MLKPGVPIFLSLVFLFCHLSCSLADQNKTGVFCSEAESTVEMVQCLSQELVATEALMADRYNRLVNCLHPAQKEKLDQGQNTWLRFRTLNAEFDASSEEGGSLYAVELLTTMVDMTLQRADELERFYRKFADGN